jgi:hypothetical protein
MAGSGAIIVYVPDAPTNVLNDPLITNENQIGLVWSEGASDGGTVVIDYRITYDQSIGTYVTLIDGLTANLYTTGVALTSGRTYKFKVESRNTVGYSLESTEISILAA